MRITEYHFKKLLTIKLTTQSFKLQANNLSPKFIIGLVYKFGITILHKMSLSYC